VHTPCIRRVGQNRIYTPCMTVCLMKPLQNTLYTHHIYVCIHGSGQPCNWCAAYVYAGGCIFCHFLRTRECLCAPCTLFSAISCVHVNAYAHRALCFLPSLACTRMLVRTVYFVFCHFLRTRECLCAPCTLFSAISCVHANACAHRALCILPFLAYT
jgi:hypothetical protein